MHSSPSDRLCDDARRSHAPARGARARGTRRGAGGRHRFRAEPAVLHRRCDTALRSRSVQRASVDGGKKGSRGAVSGEALDLRGRSHSASRRLDRYDRGHLVALLDRQRRRRPAGDAPRAETGRNVHFRRAWAFTRCRRREVAKSSHAVLALVCRRLSSESEDGRTGARCRVHYRGSAHRVCARASCACVHVRRLGEETKNE